MICFCSVLMCSLYGCPAYREKVKSAAGLTFYDLAEKSNNDVLVPCLCLGEKKRKKKNKAENENTRT